MSSATNPNPNEARALANALGEGGAQGSGLSGRQMQLNHLWGFYTCSAYANRKTDWDGHEHLDSLESDVVTQSGLVPPGYVDVGGQTLPLKYRRPTAPYWLARVIVNRFTGLLFAKKRRPKVEVPDDVRTEDWLEAFAKETRLWSRMTLARTYGGAMGSVGVGFKFVNGRPVVEVHDPRWCTPSFEDDATRVLDGFEKRYMFPREFQDAEGEWVIGDFWYRRVITTESDTVWPAVPVPPDGEEPDWYNARYKRLETVHGLGFVPVVWIQNHELQDSLDGWCDCEGTLQMCQEIDALQAQASRGVKANCDPTPVIASDREWDEVQKGSQNALIVEKGGSASYMEIGGSGTTAAMDMARGFRDQVLEVTQCVIESNIQGPARSEEETTQNYAAMYEQADKLRDQYEMGLKQLLEMVLEAVRMLATPRAVEEPDGTATIQTRVVRLRPKIERTAGGGVQKLERVVGDGELVEFKWPPYAEPTPTEANAATTAAVAAKEGGLLDLESATKYVAPLFGVEDVRRTMRMASAESRKRSDDVMGAILGQRQPGPVAEGTSPPPDEDDA